jgi:hypothetical protein
MIKIALISARLPHGALGNNNSIRFDGEQIEVDSKYN